MYIFLRFAYAKFDVSHSFFSKVIEEKPLGGLLDPPLGTGKVREVSFFTWRGGSQKLGGSDSFP